METLPRHPWDKMGDDVTRIPRSQITPAPYNPKKFHPEKFKRLVTSLRKNGMREPIVWNKRSGYQIGGHARLRALDNNNCPEGDWLVPATVHDLDDVEEKQLNTALSNREAMGEFDEYLLAEVLKTPNIDIPACGFDLGQIKTILPTVAPLIPAVASVLETNAAKWKQEKVEQRNREDAAVQRIFDGNQIGDKDEAKILADDDQFYFCVVFKNFADKMKCLERMGIDAGERFLKGEVIEKLLEPKGS